MFFSRNQEDMYHKMPLLNVNYKVSIQNRSEQNQIFCPYCKARYIFHHNQALSSKHQMKNNWREASYDTYPDEGKHLQSRGSITLEMVVVLPLFISFLVFFLFIFRVLLVQESMEEALVYASRTLAVACYEEGPKEQKTQAQLLAEARILLQRGLKEHACPLHFIRGSAAGISLLASQLTGDDIILRASYEMKMPCVLLGDYCFHFNQCVQSRKWIGNVSLEQNAQSDDVWVYITPYGSVYHCDRTCRYLDLSIRAVSRNSLAALRNADGAIYRKCERCHDGGNGTVYVTDYGTRYHSSLVCEGLKRTIYMVKLSQVGGKKACSKCGIRR